MRLPGPTHLVVGFQHQDEAERFLREFQERLAKFGLEIHPEKTRLIEFGRFARLNRLRRGKGKPETFTFLGFTHYCGTNSAGYFAIWRRTAAKRMKAKLQQISQELCRKMHEPVTLTGEWLKRVVEGYYRYHAVPGNQQALGRFRTRVCRCWRQVLRRRSQRRPPDWDRLRPVFDRWIPLPRTLHPHPDVRFDAHIQRKSRWSRAQEKAVSGDGAVWTWNPAGQHFPGAVQIVDLYHARQHLWEIAAEHCPNDEKGRKRWLGICLERLDRGKIEALVTMPGECTPSYSQLATVVSNEAGDFERNAERVRDPAFRAHGVFAGSGVMEAGCKTDIGARLKRFGRFWTVQGANAFIALRSGRLSGRFEDYWESRERIA